jgi:hypothetical protein
MRIDRYRVTAGYVTVETAVAGGRRALVDVPRGAILPADVPAAHIETELRLGTIELLAEDSPAEAATSPTGTQGATNDGGEPNSPPARTEVPAGMSVASTLEWVGDDTARAQAAWDVEAAKDSPRSTLVARLEEILTASAGQGGDGANSGAGPSVDS